MNQSARLILYCQDEFAGSSSKTAEGVLRYGLNPITAVIDRRHSGKTAGEVMGISSNAPVVDSVEAAHKLGADAMLLGCAYVGGRIPTLWRQDILKALELGLDVINGLHDMLEEDEEFRSAAAASGAQLIDLRKPPEDSPIASARVKKVSPFVVLTVGSDCSVGKMTVALELTHEALDRGIKARFLATGQTGIAIAGQGVPVDRVIGDFMAGAVEQLVLDNADGQEMLFVEGQGSLVHPGYSGVTLSILHGCAPEAMILCHKAGHETIGDGGHPIPDMETLIRLFESMASVIRPAKIVGVALNTRGLDDEEARRAVESLERETGLPCEDPVRHGAVRLVDALVNARDAKLSAAKRD